MSRFLFIIAFLFPLFLTAETVVVKTKAPQNRNAVFQYRAGWQRAFVADSNSTKFRWHVEATGYDYGSISSGSITTRDVRTFNGNSKQEALARAVGHYDPNGNKYDNMYKWNANNQESINAMNAMESEVQLPYVARSHNCLDITKSGLNAAGKYLYDPEFRLSYVTEMRRNSFDVTDLLKRIQE